jgi:hypothetical protein
MTISSVIYDMCNKKTATLTDDIHWNDIELKPYILQRWVSMSSPRNAVVVNIASNSGLVQDEDGDKLLYYLYSACAFPIRGKFKYIKKTTLNKTSTKNESDRDPCVDGHVLGKREKIEYDDLLDVLNDK